MNGVSHKVVSGVLAELDYRQFLHVDLIRQKLVVTQMEGVK
jgi:hypothetical protein